MAKKNGKPKSRTRKENLKNPCGCYGCVGTEFEEYNNLKYNINPKHKNKYKDFSY